MSTLDLNIRALKEKTWLVGLICTVFLLYPNIAWFLCDLSFVKPEEHILFYIFFAFRTLFLWGVMWSLIIYNMRYLRTLNFYKRAGWNQLLALAALGVYMLVTMVVLNFNYDNFVSIVVFQFIIAGLLGALLGYIHLLYTSQREKEKEIERLQVENLQSRCDALMNQINPHFFFNSLNGVSALVRRGEDERTLEYVDKLSDIFRYTLRSDSAMLVSLGEELKFVEAFSHVMEVRFASKLQFDVDVPAEKHSLRIPVLSLLPLLENVAVHNTVDSEHRMAVKISLNEKDQLVMENPIYPKLQKPVTNGIGLKNLQSRFELMMGTEVTAEDKGGVFRVVMQLKK
jgi:sensor histidine kinase YesM